MLVGSHDEFRNLKNLIAKQNESMMKTKSVFRNAFEIHHGNLEDDFRNLKNLIAKQSESMMKAKSVFRNAFEIHHGNLDQNGNFKLAKKALIRLKTLIKSKTLYMLKFMLYVINMLSIYNPRSIMSWHWWSVASKRFRSICVLHTGKICS